MKDYVLLFRSPDQDENDVDPEKMNAFLKKWENWISGIAAQKKIRKHRQPPFQRGKSTEARRRNNRWTFC